MTEASVAKGLLEQGYHAAISRAEDGFASADTLHASRIKTDIGRAARLLASSTGFPEEEVILEGKRTSVPLIVVQTLSPGDGLHRRLVIEPDGEVSICDFVFHGDLLDWATRKHPHPRTLVRNDMNLLNALKEAHKKLKEQSTSSTE